MDAVERLKESILTEYPRLTPDDTFCFHCHSRLSCFNQCCRDVNIFLTPYDVLRMKNALGISSSQFLDKYTMIPIDRNQKYPVVMLSMQDNDDKTCPFVTPDGCRIYSDRPWSCRMYPVGMASPKEGSTEEGFCFIMHEDVCHGREERKQWTLREWFADQNIDRYNEFGEKFKEIALHDWFRRGEPLTSRQMEMFHMVCYDLDAFRRFIFESSFFNRFAVDENRTSRLKSDDEELLLFGFEWLKFCLFREPVLTVKHQPVAETS